MSWRSWTEQGYGFPLYTGKNLGALKKFLMKRETNNKIATEIRDAEDETDLEDVLGDPVSWTVAGIIRSETGYESFIGFTSCGDTNFEEHIGFCADHPWRFKGKDAAMTLEDAQKVLEKYAAELEIDTEPDYFEAEYCG